MTQVYFISDTHFGHKNICKYRTQFSTPEEHDRFVFNNIMSVSGKRNILWLLGDSFFTKESMALYREINERFMQVNVVFGNHCADNDERIKNAREIAATCNKFGALFSYKGFWLSHAPIHPDELRGKKMIHGHVHDQTLDDNRYFNVSCENIGYKPISLNEIKERMID